jgi:RNA recognition motif-containing protein
MLINFFCRRVKVGRPGYTQEGTMVPPDDAPIKLKITEEPKETKKQTEKSSSTTSSPLNRIYVGSIHWDIGEQDLRDVFSAFGEIKTCNLIYNPETGRHKGYWYAI